MDKKTAEKFIANWRPQKEDSFQAMMAAFGRECAASAYDDASACVGMAALQLADMKPTAAALVASGDLFAKKAASLRAGEGS